MRSSSRAPMCVSGLASCSPGIGSIVAREPVLIMTVLSAKDAGSSIGKRDLDRFRSDEATGTHHQLGPARLEFIQVYLDKVIDHPALSIAHGRHVDFTVVLGDAELLASEKIGSDLGAMDDVFAGKAGDVGAGASHVLAFDQGQSLALPAEGPGEIFAGFAAA